MTTSKSTIIKEWRRRTKARLVEAMGGKCLICGYDKCHSALDLHHLDPTKKDFGFGALRADIRSWARIVEEAKKCVLLCANCHREVHHDMAIIPDDIPVFKHELEFYKVKPTKEKIVRSRRIAKTCPVCQKIFNTKSKRCSIACSGKVHRKVNWDSINLTKLWPKNSILSIAKKLGISDNGVRKRLKVIGLIK